MKCKDQMQERCFLYNIINIHHRIILKFSMDIVHFRIVFLFV